MSEFWSGWELWEKMVFVLGASIVLTILAGCVKLYYSHNKIEKHERIATLGISGKDNARNATVLRRGRREDIPFGIRAIESGVEVEGVWISRSNTPSGSVAGSPSSSPRLRASSSHLSEKKVPGIVLPQTDCALLQSFSDDRSINPMAPPDLRADNDNGSTEITDSLDLQVTSDRLTHQRVGHRPRQSSQLRYSKENNQRTTFGMMEEGEVSLDPQDEQQSIGHGLR